MQTKNENMKKVMHKKMFLQITSILRFALNHPEIWRQHSFSYSNTRLKTQMHYETDNLFREKNVLL